MGKNRNERSCQSCEGWARITQVVDRVQVPGCPPHPIAAPDDRLREYDHGTIEVGEDGTLVFRPDDTPDTVYILRPGGETAYCGVDGRTGERITVDVDRFGVALYDVHVSENDPRAWRVAAAFSQR